MTRQLPPSRIDLGDDVHLRLFTADDGEAVARAVAESLDHLRPFMPWADVRSTETSFQRDRLRKAEATAARGEGWEYGLFPTDESSVLGSFGLVRRPEPAALEIGYWLHVAACGAGYATRAAAALTDVAQGLHGITRVVIRCDVANVRSAAIPRRLGYRVVHTVRLDPVAPGEQGRQMMWVRDAEDRPSDAVVDT